MSTSRPGIITTITILTVLAMYTACGQKQSKEMEHEFTNDLIDETSPYLLQHAHNPVDWYAWNDETLKKAKDEDKLILVSIGYSACHWCHVMEHESFEDSVVAAYMNQNFICIKVDREERPDVDQVYMNAVQLMTGRGGWPLNCFALPDGRPLFGGTYFQKDQWMEVMDKVTGIWKNEREQAFEYATNLTQGVKQSELIVANPNEAKFEMADLDALWKKWSTLVDRVDGGPDRAPKFPIPNNFQYLMRYAHQTNNESVMDYVNTTLTKMARGGIYDQVGGGFARYSTDRMWKVPHFEKMMYDNGQLVSLYSEAYQKTGNVLYKETVEQTLDWIAKEMTTKKGAFYSALDADSDGEEGKYYVWKKEELETLLGDDFKLVKKYFNINSKGLWEHGNYILLREEDDEKVAKGLDLSVEDFKKKVIEIRGKLYDEREKRIRPGLDDKQLTSWNAIMMKGYIDAYRVFGNKDYLEVAEKNAQFILETQRKDDGGLWHNHKEGRSTINGFLEDYCFTIEALVALYQASFNQEYLEEAGKLCEYAIERFHDSESGMFYFNSKDDAALIARKMEVTDNVIPATNSSMAKALYLVGHMLNRQNYIDISTQMLNNVKPSFTDYGSWYSNWADLMLNHVEPFYEVAIVGEDCEKMRIEMERNYIPNKILLGSKKESMLPLLENKHVEGDTRIYVCVNKACQLPVGEVSEALGQMK
jgi:uncharacterized protein YyaL (SSP411 family)